jgi:hypothetical protein
VDLLEELAGKRQVAIFQPIAIDAVCLSVLQVSWSAEDIALRIGGHDLALDINRTAPRAVLAGNDAMQVLPRIPLYGDLCGESIADPNEKFFAETVRDLDRKVVDGSRYELIKAAGLLRLLIADGQSLMHVVNRTHRRKLTFEILDPAFRMPTLANCLTNWQGLDPAPFPRSPTVRVDLRNFLSALVLRHAGRDVTVHDVIATCANAKGGVHWGRPDSPVQAAVFDLDAVFQAAGEPASVLALSGICRIVLRGLGPLVSAVMAV